MLHGWRSCVVSAVAQALVAHLDVLEYFLLLVHLLGH